MRRPASMLVIAILLTTMVILPGTPAPTARASPSRLGMPHASQVEVPAPTLRTMDDMMADQAAHRFPRTPARLIPFRPGMDPAAYVAAKEAAAAEPRVPRPKVRPSSGAPQALVLLNCDGEDQIQAGGAFPPDADGVFGASPTAGTLEFAQVTNQHVTIWDALHAFNFGCASAGVKLLDVDLNTFFGYFDQPVFDPRVIFDGASKRWVFSAEAFPELSGAQFQFIAVSISDNATGPYFIFRFPVTGFWDFPQLGVDSQAVMVTANVFTDIGFVGSRWMFLNKTPLYSGLAFTSCLFMGGVVNLPSWAPPRVLDQNPLTWMVEAQPASNFLQLAALQWSGAAGQVCPNLVSTPTVAVTPYTVPGPAPQPGTIQVIETSDNRFQNRSTQVGNTNLGQTTLLWNVHAENIGGRATPVLFRIVVSTTPPTVQEASFSASATSFDFNPSIVANAGGTVAVSWSSTDTNVNAQVRMGSCVGATGVCSPGAGTLVFQSTVPLTGNFDPSFGSQRWGDYSFAAVDGGGNFAGGVNEEINNPSDATGGTWGTRFFVASIP